MITPHWTTGHHIIIATENTQLCSHSHWFDLPSSSHLVQTGDTSIFPTTSSQKHLQDTVYTFVQVKDNLKKKINKSNENLSQNVVICLFGHSCYCEWYHINAVKEKNVLLPIAQCTQNEMPLHFSVSQNIVQTTLCVMHCPDIVIVTMVFASKTKDKLCYVIFKWQMEQLFKSTLQTAHEKFMNTLKLSHNQNGSWSLKYDIST